MTFVVQGKEYEGVNLTFLFQETLDWQQQYLHTHVKKWIDTGNKIYVKLDTGARAGTIGELVLTVDDFDGLYKKQRKGWPSREIDTIQRRHWEIKFDDRANVVKLETTRYYGSIPGTVSFVQQPTVWCFTTKPRAKVELPVLHDHFGVQLEVGQVCLALVGRGTSQYVRLGKITRWSEKATIWVETMKTRETHPENREVTVQGSINIFVLDGDIRSKAMMAKLMFA